MVAAWIGAAYWFTASTSFANPAITIARSLSDSFSGIRPVDVPEFVAAQFAGALLALLLGRVLFVSEAAPIDWKSPSKPGSVPRSTVRSTVNPGALP